MRGDALEVALVRSRFRSAVVTLGWLLVAAASVAQVFRLEAPWPLLACPLLALALRGLPETRAERLDFDGTELHVDTPTGKRSGIWSKGRVSPVAIEVPICWHRGGRDRVVLWRDALTDADFRAVARRMRAGPGAYDSANAATLHGAHAPGAGGPYVEADR